MSDFVPIKLTSGAVYVNLDYVLKIEVGLNEGESTVLRLTNGEVLKVPHEDGLKLQERLMTGRPFRQAG